MSEVSRQCGRRAVGILRILRTFRRRGAQPGKRVENSAVGCGGTKFWGRQHEGLPRRLAEVIRRSSGAPDHPKQRQAVDRSRKTSLYLAVTKRATFRNDALVFPALLDATSSDFLHVTEVYSNAANDVMIQLLGDVWAHPELHHCSSLLTEAQQPPKDSSFFRSSGLLLSPWRKVEHLTCANSAGSRTSHQQRRWFCAAGMAERQLHTRGHCHVVLLPPAGAVSFVRAYSKTSHPDTPLYKNKTAYYNILQVSPSATHAQIKTAYYKQSFLYHPDRNAGSEEATLRFSEISEAYMVLGSRSLKKKYDRGILSQADLQGVGQPSVKEEPVSFTTDRQATSQYSPSTGMGGKSIYDFDSFFQAHYAEQLQREKDRRLRKEQLQKKQKLKDRELGRMTEISVGLLLVVGVAILLSMKSSK